MNIDHFIDYSWAKEVALVATKNNPKAALRYADGEGYGRNQEGFIDQPWAKEVLLLAASKEPQFALDKRHDYNDKDWYKEVIELAEKKLAEMKAKEAKSTSR